MTLAQKYLSSSKRSWLPLDLLQTGSKQEEIVPIIHYHKMSIPSINSLVHTNHVKAIASVCDGIDESLDATGHRFEVPERVEDGKSGHSRERTEMFWR